MAQPTETTQEPNEHSNWRQFWLLLWKNWLLQKRRVVVSVLLVLLPVVLALVHLLLRNASNPRFISNATIYDSFVVAPSLAQADVLFRQRWSLAYAPNTTLVARIVSRSATIMGVKSPTGFGSENSLEDHLMTDQNIFGAIVFLVSEDAVSLPKKIVYKVRLRSEESLSLVGEDKEIDWKTSDMFSGDKGIGPRAPENHFGGSVPGYYDWGFLAIQKAVDLSLIAEVNSSFNLATAITTQLKRYPFPPYNEDPLVVMLRIAFPLFILLSFIVIAPTICQEIVLEKENKFKESMKLMGMRTWLYWCSWLVKYLLFMLTAVIIMTILFHAPISSKGPVIVHTSATVTFVFLLLYSLSLITFCFAISTFVSKASYASAAGGILYILSYVPHFYLETIYDDMTLVQKLGASVDFNLAMGFVCIKMSQYETLGIGVQWSNAWTPVHSKDVHTMAHILIMLFIDTIIYSILTWYFDAVIPGDFGTPRPLYFPFTKDYWTGTNRSEGKSPNDDFMTLVPEDKRAFFEIPMQNAKAGIQIRGLTKTFGPNMKPAVSNLSIDMYEGNITALLGHNGAGKTTTMFMLTGFLPPSSGTAFINGLDITRDMDRIRQNLGLCPQHNILFDTLTVREHLLFFAMLKGSPLKKAVPDVTEMIKVLDMEEKTNAPAKTLSGGQQRKLSIGIALISGSKFVILDEPTSGMDPEARRQTWDILQSQRKDRTMILSTHYMDEADLLGDRIAIMSNGQIQCYGTPMFLKNKFGVGYHLTIVKTPNCDVNQLVVVMKSQIPSVHMESNEATEATFVLPSQQLAKFEKLFETLESDHVTLGIVSFGVAVTTMEEVFLRVKDTSTIESGPRMSKDGIIGITPPVGVTYQKETGCKRHTLQVAAMIYKRFIHSIRNRVITLSQILIPVIFTILACLTLRQQPRSDDFPPLNLDLTHFTGPLIPYEVRSPTASAQRLASCYEASVSKQGRIVFINSEPGYSTMDAYLIGIGKYHADQYNWNYQIGATIEEDPDGKLNITGFFNNQAYHTIAISLSHLGNALMRCYGNQDYQIETVNHPLPKKSSKRIKDSVNEESSRGFSFSYSVSFGMAFLMSTFLIFLVKERMSGAKHSQLVSGVELKNFWLATFLWDFCNYLVPCVLIIVIILSFHTEGYWQHSGIIFLDLMLYGWSMLSFTYIISFLCEEASVGFVWLSFLNIITGTFTTIIVTLLRELTSSSTWKTVELVFYIIFPNYCFNVVLQNIYKNYNNHKVCNQMAEKVNLADFCASLKKLGQQNPCCPGNCGFSCIEVVDNYLSWDLPGVCRPLVFMFLQGIVFFLVIYFIETDAAGSLLKALTPNRVSQAILNEMEADEDGSGRKTDTDVLNERELIRSKPIQELVKTDAVVIQDLTKLYGNFVAVNQLNLGVPERECFGLLGVNGAGKTTTFKMLTGEIRPSFGNAYIAGLSVQDDLAQVRQKIGYCGQFDSIIDQLTVQETVWMYACARGIPGQVREQVIDQLIDHLTLKPFTNKLAGTLSGGNKRKLCVAVALMGNPTVVFLDEPTTGVDPEARRHVWNTLAAARNAGSTIILTSHSMEECESICTRLAILVNGRFMCLGSLQHLKDKFSEGYTLIIKLQRSAATDQPEELQERIQRLKTFIGQTFPESVLKDHHENLLTYQVKTRDFKWSQIFGIMERAKVTYQIEDYSVGQTTLEQLFIGFARLQRGPRDISSKKKLLK